MYSTQTAHTTHTTQKQQSTQQTTHTAQNDKYSYKKALQRTRNKVLNELKLPIEWVKYKLEELKYMINPYTMLPFDGYTVTFIQLRKEVEKVYSKTVTYQQPFWNDNIEVNDLIQDPLTNHIFSRQHFYNNYYFQLDLVNYYWNGLRSTRSYCPVMIIYYMNLKTNTKDPSIKIGKVLNLLKSQPMYGGYIRRN